jgi:hypothetical protein
MIERALSIYQGNYHIINKNADGNGYIYMTVSTKDH